MASYLITGASRGIGLELTKQLLALPTTTVGQVFAVTRDNSSMELNRAIAAHPGRLHSIVAEVTSKDSVANAVEEVASILDNGGLDVLVNNAGTSSNSTEISQVSPEQMSEVFNVNVNSAQIMISCFLPLLQQGKEKKVINVSSTLGSSTLARTWPMGAMHAYRISKAAMNMLNSLYASEHPTDGFTFLLLSPGWLKTDLGTSYADLEPAVGVAEVKRIILEADASMNGKYVNIRVPGWAEKNVYDKYEGEEIPFRS